MASRQNTCEIKLLHYFQLYQLRSLAKFSCSEEVMAEYEYIPMWWVCRRQMWGNVFRNCLPYLLLHSDLLLNDFMKNSKWIWFLKFFLAWQPWTVASSWMHMPWAKITTFKKWYEIIGNMSLTYLMLRIGVSLTFQAIWVASIANEQQSPTSVFQRKKQTPSCFQSR